ncbi:GNAT family N-acetyltransferase [uncultured Eudoraea sp.]|uniref:GNAT family N-acetyltransferase n=1 Tax=uncultured Eudoraea sp. TaxID=1035614 RepID=UPI00261F1FFF|nr:GNAT family N-acetyltransferase [uncultured Eudoraea sp.]
MGNKVLYKTNFYFNFFEKNIYPKIYTSIKSNVNTIPINSKTLNDFELEDFGTLIIELFPSYLTYQLDSRYAFDLLKIFRVKGYCITIGKEESLEGYLKTYFKPNFRTSMRRRLKGLEKCFNVSYRMFYGNIERGEYDYLMNELHAMLIRRFAQRNDQNMALSRWKDYYDNTFELINENKASLYVIYDDVKPIQISLSYHCDKILFLSIPSYNIDYSKFGLGNISVLKILEWCIVNKYEVMDMGFGAFDYKVKWCNQTYDFEHHLFYTKSSILSRMLVFYISVKTKLINYLLSKKVNLYYHQLKTFFLGGKKSDLKKFSKEQVDANSLELNKCKIIYPMKDNSFAFLRRALCDFLYTYQENVSKVEVYEFERNRTFFFKVENQILKITYES